MQKTISMPFRIPTSLLKKAKKRIQKMIDEITVNRVLEPTDWIAPTVFVLKPGNKIRLYIDLSELNKSVKRDIYQFFN